MIWTDMMEIASSCFANNNKFEQAVEDVLQNDSV